MPEDDCIFCKIAAGHVPSQKVYEDGEVVAFPDIHPLAPVHLLVIPRRHVGALADADGDSRALAGRCFAAAVEVAYAAGLAEGGYRLVANQGANAGQEVAHLHIHVLGGRSLGSLG